MLPKKQSPVPSGHTPQLWLVDSPQTTPGFAHMFNTLNPQDETDRPDATESPVVYADRAKVLDSALRMMKIHANTFRKLAE